MYSYDAVGNKITEVDPTTPQRQATYTYDRLNRLIRVVGTDPDGTATTYKPQATEYKYDNQGIQISVTTGTWNGTAIIDARITAYEHDGLGRVTKETLPDPDASGSGLGLLSTEFTYNGYGDVVSLKDQSGRTTNYEYDHMGRQVKEVLPPATLGATRAQTDTTYDADGRVLCRDGCLLGV